jgi:hypothetical protein
MIAGSFFAFNCWIFGSITCCYHFANYAGHFVKIDLKHDRRVGEAMEIGAANIGCGNLPGKGKRLEYPQRQL